MSHLERFTWFKSLLNPSISFFHTLQQELKEFEKEIENNDELHKKVLHAEKDHLNSKNKSNLKDPEAMKEKRGILASAREELQTVSKKVKC